MILLSLLLQAHAAEAPCAPLEPVPATLQVAWVSRLGDRAGGQGWMEVVRSGPLQQLVHDKGGDATAVLRGMGLVGPKGDGDGRWKVTLFDVRREWLCRPMEGGPGALTAGVAVCDHPRRGGVHRKAWTGCGYLTDVVTRLRTLDVFRIDWPTATTEGFCLLPFARFLHGRPSTTTSSSG